MRNAYITLPNTQRGATLLLALLILIMIMMHGIPTVMNNTLDERMAGNTRNRDLAFQAAEHALKDAETIIRSQTIETMDDYFDPGSASDCSDHGNGFLCHGEDHSNDAAYWRDDGTSNTFDWDNTRNYLTPTGTISEVAEQPRYVVEKMPGVSFLAATPPTQLCPTPLPTGSSCITKNYYRITARGVGKDSDAVVILQTMFEFTPAP